MRKLFSVLLVFMLLLCMFACNRPGPRTIEQPHVDAAGTGTIDIASVDLSDTATTVTLAIDYKPGWWIRIDSATVLRADGRDYAATATSDNYTLGERFTVSAGGKDTITIFFEPLPFNTRSVDFIENIENGFTIYGIDLTGEKVSVPTADLLPAEVRDIDASEIFTEPVNDVAMTKLRFHVLNYRPEYGNLLMRAVSGTDCTKFIKIDLDDNGEGELETNLYGTTRAYLQLNDLYTDFGCIEPILLAPGTDTDIYFDAQMHTDAIDMHRNADMKPGDRVFDNGRYAALNRELKNSGLVLTNNISDRISDNISLEAYVDTVMKMHAENLAAINASTLSEPAKEYMKRSAEVNTLGLLSDPYAKGNYHELYSRIKDTINPLDSRLKGMPYYVYSLNGWDIWPEEVTSSPDYKANRTYLTRDFAKAEYGNLSPEVLKGYEGADPFYAKALNAAQDEAVKHLTETQARIAALPDDAPEKFLEQTIAPYKGKVVLVDLWNTWCGPCRRALKANEPLKTGELKSPDLEWVYIADTTSDPDQYAEMIQDIAGHHAMASSEQIQALRRRFNVDGIPFYIMVDRDGIAHPRPDFRDHEEMVKTLKAELAK